MEVCDKTRVRAGGFGDVCEKKEEVEDRHQEAPEEVLQEGKR